MTRPWKKLARAAAAALALAVLVPVIALAQTDSRPEIDSAPASVRFRDGAHITGHLDNGVPGSRILLKRRKAGESWAKIDTALTDDAGRVDFRLDALRVSADYRLVWRDDMGAAHKSDAARITVSPRLRFDVEPNHIMKGRRIRLEGSLFPMVPARSVVIKKRVAGDWRKVARISVQDGRFNGSLRANHVGRRALKVVFRGDELNRRKDRGTRIRVYEPDPATWYGPGFYGQRTACGKRLSSETLGVAHRRLPCGTEVSILYQGRTITVPVIDRGPYGSADWDLTKETAERLGFEGSDTIGTDH